MIKWSDFKVKGQGHIHNKYGQKSTLYHCRKLHNNRQSWFGCILLLQQFWVKWGEKVKGQGHNQTNCYQKVEACISHCQPLSTILLNFFCCDLRWPRRSNPKCPWHSPSKVLNMHGLSSDSHCFVRRTDRQIIHRYTWNHTARQIIRMKEYIVN